MRYKHIKTGTIIDSPSKIVGKAWELVDESVEIVNEETEFIEEEVNLAEMTNRELEKLAKDENITLTADDKRNKETRIAAIVKAFE